ncbi:hypothetical protein GOV12_02220 [Candidatus Pacearchaeota archaeon]|nr:hypothetical protein [Candidatus Pacearchaeota archaeon]
MIYELSFVLVGGANLALEKKWGLVQSLMKKYPWASWKKIINLKKGIGKYIIKVD